jgi:nucleoside-diphosphate-sugar epimerase
MNILITGSDGFIGNNITHILETDPTLNIFKGTRKSINLYQVNSIRNYLAAHKIDVIIHCAIEGGDRLDTDTHLNFYNNLLMYNNLSLFYDSVSLIINISSGAEFNRCDDIVECNENTIFDKSPPDFYGLAKNIISRLAVTKPNNINIRLFGCFNHLENESKFIKRSIKAYLNRTPIIIHGDKWMDYIYMNDFGKIILCALRNWKSFPSDINATYLKKHKLSDIANIINSISSYTVPVEFSTPNLGKSYTGDGTKLSELDIKLTGLETGILECYNNLI